MAKHYQIFIHDNHPLFRAELIRVIKSQLTQTTLYEVDNPLLWLSKIKRLPGNKLLLLDILADGGYGLAHIYYLKRYSPQIKIIAMTPTNNADSTAAKAYWLGANGIFPKKSGATQLIQLMHNIKNHGPTPNYNQQITPEEREQLSFICDRLKLLSIQQYKVLILLTAGKVNKQIAQVLGVAEATVKAHLTSIFKKLGVRNRTQAIITMKILQSYLINRPSFQTA
ncbi:response regulator transcription factor [Endozoicomonas sp. SM1973]|uniref:Response regulator transcription factor n=1 Tax=Spartinivicinus marinus TaxID=2994442 RepID=A0A853IJ98_9GAMM|nr:response regulator transcription factor [Spartinivicinus marinus]MCX4029106.1 response regulator transcription factor [Spartinivicinus marinus]NYZ67726.1 response regulator transcription factor [Spartinivicinus marinus]